MPRRLEWKHAGAASSGATWLSMGGQEPIITATRLTERPWAAARIAGRNIQECESPHSTTVGRALKVLSWQTVGSCGIFSRRVAHRAGIRGKSWLGLTARAATGAEARASAGAAPWAGAAGTRRPATRRVTSVARSGASRAVVRARSAGGRRERWSMVRSWSHRPGSGAGEGVFPGARQPVLAAYSSAAACTASR